MRRNKKKTNISSDGKKTGARGLTNYLQIILFKLGSDRKKQSKPANRAKAAQISRISKEVLKKSEPRIHYQRLGRRGGVHDPVAEFYRSTNMRITDQQCAKSSVPVNR